MSNGYATDGSSGSNKRVRHAPNATTIPPPAGMGTNPKNRAATPITKGQVVISSFVESLHTELQPALRDIAMQSLHSYAAHFRASEKYEEERDDDDYVPADCKIALVLKPLSAVERDPGFKDLLRETETVVLECRKLLKSQAMKCTEKNVAALKEKVTGD